MQIISRKDAKNLGLPHYFTGVACVRGHVAPRNAKSSNCLECGKQSSRIFYEKNSRETIDSVSKWRSENKDKIQKYKRDFVDRNREKICAESRAYREENPLRSLAQKHNSRAKRFGATGSINADDIQKSLHDQGDACAICGVSFKESQFSIDHDIPLSRGGKNDPSNIQMLCVPCNVKKRDRTTSEYLRTTKQEIF